MLRLGPFCQKPHGKPRVDDQRIFIETTFIGRNDGRGSDTSAELGPHKTLYNPSNKGIFTEMMAGWAANHIETKTVMIDAMHLQADHALSNLSVKKAVAAASDAPSAA